MRTFSSDACKLLLFLCFAWQKFAEYSVGDSGSIGCHSTDQGSIPGMNVTFCPNQSLPRLSIERRPARLSEVRSDSSCGCNDKADKLAQAKVHALCGHPGLLRRRHVVVKGRKSTLSRVLHGCRMLTGNAIERCTPTQ